MCAFLNIAWRVILNTATRKKIISGYKGLYSVSNKTNGIKIGLQLHRLWQIHGHQVN